MTKAQETRVSTIWKGVDANKYTWGQMADWLFGAHLFSASGDDRSDFMLLYGIAMHHDWSAE